MKPICVVVQDDGRFRVIPFKQLNSTMVFIILYPGQKAQLVEVINGQNVYVTIRNENGKPDIYSHNGYARAIWKCLRQMGLSVQETKHLFRMIGMKGVECLLNAKTDIKEIKKILD